MIKLKPNHKKHAALQIVPVISNIVNIRWMHFSTSTNLMQANSVIIDGCIIKHEKAVKTLLVKVWIFRYTQKEFVRELSALTSLSFYLSSISKLALFRAFLSVIPSHCQYCSTVWQPITAVLRMLAVWKRFKEGCIVWNSIALTSNIFTELGDTMKYGGGGFT